MEQRNIKKRFVGQRIDEDQRMRRQEPLLRGAHQSVGHSLRGKYRGVLSSSAEFSQNKRAEKALEK